jgi:hypothetical protein
LLKKSCSWTGFAAPDFLVKKYGKSVAIEAVIVGRKDDNPPRYLKEFSRGKPADEVLEAQKNQIPIMFGSPLYSKLQKRYWEYSHVREKPLILAIADFHDDQSMLWTSTALTNYLYGTQYAWHHDDQGKLVLTPSKIEKHQLGHKEVPSGFFFLPEAEHISAVLFSSSGTISKFNRIGREAGFWDRNTMMIRIGTCYNHDPHAAIPNIFRYKVDERGDETWAEGLSMFHNPRALYPVSEELFPSIAHHRFRNKLVVSRTPKFHPFSSMTLNITPEPQQHRYPVGSPKPGNGRSVSSWKRGQRQTNFLEETTLEIRHKLLKFQRKANLSDLEILNG